MNMNAPQKFRDILALGYDRLLCVVPPDAPIHNAGKRPGKLGQDGWHGVNVRTFDGVTPEQVDQWQSWGSSLGLRCDGKFIGLDIDSLSPEWSAKIHRAALRLLGPAPVRIGRAPKCILLYKAASSVSYRQLRFDDGIDEKKPGLVECLSGAGGTKWFVALGLHKDTGRPYLWPEGIPHADELTTISEEQVASFFDKLREALPKAVGTSSSDVDRTTVDQASLKGDLKVIARAAAAIDCRPETFGGYDNWRDLAVGLRAACQDDEALGLELFCAATERAGIEDPEEDAERVYYSLHPPFAFGADYVLAVAAKHGSPEYKESLLHERAATWFEPPADEEEPLFAAEEARQRAETRSEDVAAKAARFRFLDFDAAADSALAQSNQPLIKGLLDCGTMSIMYGDSNEGKTFVAMDLGFHVGAGLEYGGMKTTQGLVVYVAAEGGNGAKRRVMALRLKYGEAAHGVRFKLLPMAVDLRRPDADLPAFVAALKGIGEPIALVIVDTLSRALAGGDENSSVDMGAIVKHFDIIRAEIGAHLMVVHHTGKNKANGARGHSLLRAATDTELEIEGGVITVTKQRDLEKSWSSAFSLEVRHLGLDNDFDAITSCTVQLISAQAVKESTEKRDLTIAETRVLACLKDMLEDLGVGVEGVTLEQLVSSGRQELSGMGLEGVRTHLRNLKEKKQVVRPKRGFWALQTVDLVSTVTEA